MHSGRPARKPPAFTESSIVGNFTPRVAHRRELLVAGHPHERNSPEHLHGLLGLQSGLAFAQELGRVTEPNMYQPNSPLSLHPALGDGLNVLKSAVICCQDVPAVVVVVVALRRVAPRHPGLRLLPE